MTNDFDRLVYRLATADDLDTLVELRIAFLAELHRNMPAEDVLRSTLSSYFAVAVASGEFVGYLADFEGRVVATSGLTYHRGPPSPWNMQGCEAYVMNMYTLPEWRGRGIAGQLLARLVEHARPDCCRVVLHALPQARSVYLKAGFVPLDPQLAEMRLEFSRA